MKAWLVGVLVAIAVILGAFAVLYAEGSPTAPTAQLIVPITPGASQNLVFNLNSGVYSAVSPNTVWGLGLHFTYTAIERTSTNMVYILANNQTTAPAIGTSFGNFYQLGQTATVTTVAACTGISCAGVTENVTLSVSMTVVTPFQAWVTPGPTYVFSSTTSGACSVGSPCPPASPANAPQPPAQPSSAALNSFLLELFVPLTLLIAFEAFGVYAITKHPALIATGFVAVGLVILEFVVL